MPGGGVTYIRALDALEGMKGDNADETTGIEIIKRAIEEPLRQIVANAGKEGAVVVQKVREGKGDFGYNARTDVYENLHAAGVVDPAKVTRRSAGERRFHRRHVPDHRMRHRREERRQTRNADEPRYGWHGRNDVTHRFPR